MNNLKFIRENLKMTQVEFSASLDISAPRLCQYENNKRKLPIDIAYKISKRYNIDLEDIYDVE